MTADVDILVFFSLLFDVSDFLGDLLEIVFVGGVLRLELCLAVNFTDLVDFQLLQPGRINMYIPCCFFDDT
jgi:hypothetical protein